MTITFTLICRKVVSRLTKIDIISGFLGAGKTTLIKKLLAEGFNGEKCVLIENEFGEIGIDGGFLKDAGVEITEMNSGCICCSLVGDFGTALEQVIDQYHPDRVIIEPSGVGKLSDVIRAVEDVAEKVEELELNSYTAVVDAKKCKIYMKNFGEFFNNQIEYAKTIILSRTQLIKEDKLNDIVEMIKTHNDKATIVTTPWDDITGAKIIGAMEAKNDFVLELLEEEEEHQHHDHEHEHHHDHDHEHEHHHDHDHEHEHHHHEHDHDDHCGCGHDHHHHHADDVFTSWGHESAKKFDRAHMESILDELSESTEYGVILRAKGMVPDTEGGWIYFDLVPGEYELRNGEADVTGRLCVIGSELKEDKIEALFGL